jgi:hypothetical protein
MRDRVLDDQASMLVEAMVVVPVLMLLVVLLVQFALWAHSAQIVQLAASEGDRVTRDFGGGPQVGEARANSILRGAGSDLSSSNVVVVIDPGGMARVTVTGTSVSILPGIATPVSSVQIGPIQEFRASE